MQYAEAVVGTGWRIHVEKVYLVPYKIYLLPRGGGVILHYIRAPNVESEKYVY